ncbi:hypothetical protein EYC84_006590 [Monilinia fructicola]|uniref:Uncharacterized protein n=1 Tax=Monilinia fructicola TaxID=38448 RepID=A0A5M9K8C3_MONFR|nr:hypothetical protein EYC84_006590 [Monilinia fructicola]
MFGKFYHVIRKYAIDTSLNVFTIGVASTIYITDAQRRKDQHRTIISNNNTIELLEDRIEGLVEERLQLLYKRSAADSSSPLTVHRLDHVSPPNLPQ